MINRLIIILAFALCSALGLRAQSTVQDCPTCHGEGYRLIECKSCADGTLVCKVCAGKGVLERTCPGCLDGYVTRQAYTPCDSCHATGVRVVHEQRTCKHCHEGRIVERQGNNEREVWCQTCRGTGVIDITIETPCPACNGEKYSGTHPVRKVHDECHGTGKVVRRCTTCDGRGGRPCTRCGGKGYFRQPCTDCGRTGKIKKQ